MTEKEEQQSRFSYEVFDRQLNTFYMMCQVLMQGWEDYSTQEMNFDIRSLCTKASRLCYMADQDFALQHNDLTHQRKFINQTHIDNISQIVINEMSPFLKKIIENYQATKILEGHKSGMFSAQMSILFPKLHELLIEDGMSENSIANFLTDINIVEKTFLKKNKFAKYPGVKPEERFWNIFQLYGYSCYLVYHFRRVNDVCGRYITDDEAGRLTEMGVQKYTTDPKGKMDIDLYISTLEYNNDRLTLNIDQMRSEQRKLQNEVPDSLLLPFLHHVNDAYEMGKEVNRLTFTAEEYISLLSATAKWQLLEQRIYECQNPNEIKPQFDNEVFVTVLNGRPVKMEELRKTISLMVKLVSRKNQWFCVWSVLKHHNLLGNYSHEAFARQMMSSYWFGDVEDYKRFSGDTLREYKRYFSDYDYTQWDNDEFLEQKQLFGMTKWSNSLCQKFQKLCQEMEQVIVGWKYL